MPDKIFDMETSAEHIRMLCKEKGFSAAFLAETFGVSKQAIYSWWKGTKSPSKDHTTELAALLGVQIDEIMRYKDANKD